MASAQGLSSDQQSQLELFQEVTASRDAANAVQVLESCNWNVEQALQLHWASTEGEPAATGSAGSAAANGLGAPLLAPGEQQQQQHGVGAARGNQSTAPGMQASTSLLGWFARGLLYLGQSILGILRVFLLGTAGGQLGGGYGSGVALTQALTNAYGTNLRLPRFFEGSFAQALQAARREAKLLVIYLHSEHGRYTQRFCSEVLSEDFIRGMLDENFLLWGGDIASMEAHRVSQMIHARQYPWFCVLLPASAEEIRVIGALNGDIQVDAASGLLAACLDEMETHRTEIIARREQHAEDRQLREQQDLEYQQALEMDRRRSEEQQALEQQQEEARRAEEAERRKKEEELAKLQAAKDELENNRRQRAAAILPEDPAAASRISLRLPAGQRVQRKFASTTTLADIYAWAECLPFLPENEGKGLQVPDRFMLKTSFPSKDLSEMSATIEDLQLSGTNILLTALEDDD